MMIRKLARALCNTVVNTKMKSIRLHQKGSVKKVNVALRGKLSILNEASTKQDLSKAKRGGGSGKGRGRGRGKGRGSGRGGKSNVGGGSGSKRKATTTARGNGEKKRGGTTQTQAVRGTTKSRSTKRKR